jgi:uncharacterized membrane protein YphA (DoxX/SURF4 family)
VDKKQLASLEFGEPSLLYSCARSKTSCAPGVMNADFFAALGLAAQIYVGAALLWSGIYKARDLRIAAEAVADYQMVPRSLTASVAVAVAVLELGAGAGLLLGQQVGLPVAFALITGFTAAAASALRRGLNISCHCAGSDERLSRRVLIRNGALLGAVVLASVASPWQWNIGNGSGSSPMPLTLPIALAAALLISGATFVWSALSAFGAATSLRRTL